MGNSKLRREAAAALKGTGFRRLYKGRGALKHLDAMALRRLIYLGNMRSGDLVNDCDYFNHIVASRPVPERIRWGVRASFWFISFEKQVPYTDGSFSCGCPDSPCPPLSREEIESHLRHDDDPETIPFWKEQGWWSEQQEAQYARLVAGEHVCDEHGIKLPEWAITKEG